MEYALLGIACLFGIFSIYQAEKISILKLKIAPMEREISKLTRVATSKYIKVTYERPEKARRTQPINFAATSVPLAIVEFNKALRVFDQKYISGYVKFSNGKVGSDELFFQYPIDGPVETITNALEGMTRWPGICFVTGRVALDIEEEVPKPKVLIKVVEVLPDGSYEKELDDIVAQEISEVTKHFPVTVIDT